MYLSSLFWYSLFNSALGIGKHRVSEIGLRAKTKRYIVNVPAKRHWMIQSVFFSHSQTQNPLFRQHTYNEREGAKFNFVLFVQTTNRFYKSGAPGVSLKAATRAWWWKFINKYLKKKIKFQFLSLYLLLSVYCVIVHNFIVNY